MSNNNKQTEPQFYFQNLEQVNYIDLDKWIQNGELEGLVDESMGGIIGYINQAHTERIATILNQQPTPTKEQSIEQLIQNIVCELDLDTVHTLRSEKQDRIIKQLVELFKANTVNEELERKLLKINQAFDCDKAVLSELGQKLTAKEIQFEELSKSNEELLEALKGLTNGTAPHFAKAMLTIQKEEQLKQ